MNEIEPITPIFTFFQEKNEGILKYREITKSLKENRKEWKKITSVKVKDFFDYLIKNKQMMIAAFNFPNRSEIRYLFKEYSLYKILNSIYRDSYFSHKTAVYFHGLIKNEPKEIFINTEQTKKRRYEDSDIKQSQIDLAFKNNPRLTKNIAYYDDRLIYGLNGMYTGRIGVSEINLQTNEKIKITDLERTLIDISVRPQYLGGTTNVQEIYCAVKNRIEIQKLFSYLEKINFVYPYKQVIGFYLENAGVSYEDVIKFTGEVFKYKFYLAHKMTDIKFSTKWNLFYT